MNSSECTPKPILGSVFSFSSGCFPNKSPLPFVSSWYYLKGGDYMKKNKITLEEHNDNFMLILSGMLMGASICAIAHLFVDVVLR